MDHNIKMLESKRPRLHCFSNLEISYGFYSIRSFITLSKLYSMDLLGKGIRGRVLFSLTLLMFNRMSIFSSMRDI